MTTIYLWFARRCNGIASAFLTAEERLTRRATGANLDALSRRAWAKRDPLTAASLQSWRPAPQIRQGVGR